MAIFNKGSIASVSETTVISSGAKIEGSFYFNSMLHLDGEITGDVTSSSVIVIGKSGVLKGQVKADKIVINGIFEGEMSVDSLEILSGGVLNGNIVVKQLSIENGGKFNGSSKIVEKDEEVAVSDSVEETNQDAS
ncbi:polymer-forming cytoskeletal protein [Campylobacter insulaenigrae]|uniref:Polymer-forming cytoskeletal family protein n=1 Tax=Campylobacter insulaenigrae TaxID=260714 RepID=A0ABY3G3M0_9BACT|nr:polymer-forming cytoskeletal protein [Campylobacter insulaenigrae]MCR6574294.1 polymer-forming cytoskeletal protein [Campylobacter insulaenigrae]MCR6575910.1 polymer-forming cytoskeletal protein [Campylobacter insulaenigrae]MCR6578017.1 polymer-forming cytoskeletal protein [Campylobacter insulaenigrae]MCR6579378.1 polymer-forming cytoskeletal protein [Campylobacter insulaenigrae]MCR6584914.1 polymer-forming cytoskeletal protein [Campylobacter insulaenigrae]